VGKFGYSSNLGCSWES